MDVSKEILDKLMGRDRNKTKDEIKHRDHYSNKDVCKPFLICFCFNTLFPNTNYDEGPCKMRHDPFLKDMFDSDKNKGDHEKQYLIECINWIEKRLGDVEVRVKKNQALIDSKSNYTSERPKEIVDMLIGIDKEIEETMKQAEIFGQNGQILESERCMNDVERLRQKKREVEAMGDEQANAQKQQKICEICGAIQTINDTEKRITTHLEGKIHQGFLRLRNEIETLRIRLDILNNLNKSKEEPKDKQIKKSRSRSHRKSRSKGKEVKKDKERERERDREREKDKDKDKERVDKQKDRERERDREKQRERERQRDRPRDRERERSKDKDRSYKDQDRNRDRERDRYRDRDHREKSRDRDHKDHKKKHRHDKSRDRQSQ